MHRSDDQVAGLSLQVFAVGLAPRAASGATRVVGRSQELPPEAKQSAVIAFCTRPASAQAVADEVGVSRGSLYKWRNQLGDVPR